MFVWTKNRFVLRAMRVMVMRSITSWSRTGTGTRSSFLPYFSNFISSPTILLLLDRCGRQTRLQSLDLFGEESNRVIENGKRTDPRNTNLLFALRTSPVVLRHEVQEVTATPDHLTTTGKNNGILDEMMVCVAKEDCGRVDLHLLSALRSMVFIQTRKITTQYNSAPGTHLYSPLHASFLAADLSSVSLRCTDTSTADDGQSSDPILLLTSIHYSNAIMFPPKRGLQWSPNAPVECRDWRWSAMKWIIHSHIPTTHLGRPVRIHQCGTILFKVSANETTIAHVTWRRNCILFMNNRHLSTNHILINRKT